VELIVLGASGTWPVPGAATSGYLVKQDGFNLWMDAGSGTLANLQRYIEVPEIHGIVVSHEHPDHMVDLYPCFYARYYGELGEPHLPVYVPTGFPERAGELVSIDSQVVMRTTFDWREVTPGESFDIGPFKVKTEPMAHLGLVALGFRIEANGAVRPCFFHDPIGNVRQAPLDRILRRDLPDFRGRLRVPEDPLCQRCVCSIRAGARSALWQ